MAFASRPPGRTFQAVITYDARLAAGCVEAGVEVESPGLAADWWTAGRSAS